MHASLYVFFATLVVMAVVSPAPHKPSGETNDSLVLVHVLFRHGDRTTDDVTDFYPKDPYRDEEYYPYGKGQLTNKGKRTEYKIGKALHQKYNSFLGSVYTPDILDARSTDVNRTKMSLELVLASLFPPRGKEIWLPGLNWQPIPYNYREIKNDALLYGIDCPNIEKYLKKSKYNKAALLQHTPVLNYLTNYTGTKYTNIQQAFELYFILRTEQEWGFQLPQWTQEVFPEKLERIAIDFYYDVTSTTELKRTVAGYLLQRIIQDSTQKIAGKLIPESRKLFLYSAHEINVATVLLTLGVFDPQIPPYGSYVSFEVHNLQGEYGVKVFYQNYTEASPLLMSLPTCGEFCPLSNFSKLVKEYMPQSSQCG